MKKLLSIFGASLLSAFLSSGVGHALPYTELGDASNLFSGAQLVPTGVSELNGRIGFGDEGDIYKMNFGGGSNINLSIYMTDGFNLFGNPQMFLFDGLGHAVTSDDDSGFLDDAWIHLTVAPGTYYLGVGDANMRAFGTGASWNIGGSIPGSFGTLNKIENITTITPFDYYMFISPDTSATIPSGSVPEPSSLVLFGIGLMGSVWRLRKNSSDA